MSKEIKTKNKNKKKEPPDSSIQSVQFDLFKRFISNDMASISNAVESWEGIPKYFLTPRQVSKLRTEAGHADPYKWEYVVNDNSTNMIKIQPALIEQEDGSYKAYFPGVTEEIIEEALKRIISDQHLGIHDPEKSETWVRFSLSMLYKELKENHHSRSRPEIKHAIEVMSSCILTFYIDKKEVWKGSILQDLVTVGRDKYLAETDSQHIARLPLFISHSINHLQYRQFNYDRLMKCNEQLSRWIYKRLINRYTQASLMNTYHFMYSDIKQGSGLLQQERETDNRKKIISSLNELKAEGVIWGYELDQRREGRKIIDIKYTIQPSHAFVSEQKAANKRDSAIRIEAQQTNLSVDKI